MNIHRIMADFDSFEETSISAEHIKIKAIDTFIKSLPSEFEVSTPGFSFEKKPIHLIKWGKGETKILMWGGMHGDEPTASATLCDLCNFLQHSNFQKETEKLAKKITLYFIPIVNPDGVERYTRENAQNIDINRDFLNLESPEAILLKQTAITIKPQFAFNLHNQNTLWSAGNAGFPASLSFLAPSPDEQNHIPKNRKKAMRVISSILPHLNTVLPKQIGKWDDTYEARAFGDQFQAMGIATILIEAGGVLGQQNIRPFYFSAILLSIQSIAHQEYKKTKTKAYKALPQNEKHHVHLLLKNIHLKQRVDIALNYKTCLLSPKNKLENHYEIVAIAPKIHKKFFTYQTIDATLMHLDREITDGDIANFKLYQNETLILAFENGILSTF